MQPTIHDAWSPLSYVPALGDAMPQDRPTWVDVVDSRRLAAYRVLDAYKDNVRRYLAPKEARERKVVNVDGKIDVTKPPADSHREYGDAALIIDTAKALVLGEAQTIEFPTDEPTPKGAPVDPVEEWVREWARKERLTQKLLDGETKSVGLGDGVYVLGVNSSKQRPTLRVYHPGFYFPDTQTPVPGWVEEDFPPIVHLAWEEEDPHGVVWVVRHTWQLFPLQAPASAPWGGVMEWECHYRHVRYRLDGLIKNATVYSPELSRTAHVVQDWTPLGVDFIPVVHVPNTPDEWGESVLLRVGQILDDIQYTDTDLAQGAATSAAPVFVTEGAPVSGLTGAPGTALGFPEGGSGAWADTSKNLTAWHQHINHLLDRLAVNARLAQALLGRIQPNDVPSGYALALGFHPARQLMRECRTVRNEKYPLILRFALRLAQAQGWVDAAPTPQMVVTLGASLPADLPTAVETVKELLPINGMSTATAVRVLVQAGLPIEDAQEEVEAIRKESFDAAVKLFEATGNAAAAAAMLGVDPVTLPPGIARELEGGV